MKRTILLLTFIIPFLSFAQTTRVTTMDGDFYNPLIWSPVGLPASGDMLTINHTVNMNLDIYYTAGQILISNSGSLIEDGTPRSMWINGGSLVNNGVYSSHLLWVSNGGYITNTGSLNNIDSLLAQAAVTNSGIASINDFWIAVGGSMDNSGTLTNTDSMFVQGPFVNSGFANVYDLAVDEMATLDNSYILTVTNNMHNQGQINNTWSIDVANDFSNCNTQNFDGVINNDGVFCIGNDFLNCGGDTITGSGNYYIGNLSSNLGAFTGTHFFHTPNGSLTLNTGTIDVTVTLTTGACTAGVSEEEAQQLEVYPNPTEGIIELSATNVDYQLYDYTGKVVLDETIENHTLDLRELQQGVYLLKVDGAHVHRIVKK